MNTDMKKRIAIIGGIGSGKSVVSQILRVMGFPVYDCDAEAKRLMDNSQKIKSRIVDAFGEESLLNGQLNRPYLATMVFGHPENLKKLNGIVHPEVHADFEQWVSECNADAVFVETAIHLNFCFTPYNVLNIVGAFLIAIFYLILIINLYNYLQELHLLL